MLSYFSGIPRREQVVALEQLGQLWADFDCFVIQAPTGTGKTRLAAAIARWAESFEKTVTIVPPDTTLQEQYERDTDLPSLWGAKDYRCQSNLSKRCSDMGKKKLKLCAGICPHVKAKEAASYGARVMHTATYLGTRKSVGYPNVVIFDEAHQLIRFQQDKVGVKLWRHQHWWPLDISTHEDVVAWIDSLSANMPREAERSKAKKLILKRGEDVLIRKELVPYFNREEWCLRVVPLSVRSAAPILWPKSVGKVILLSATIGRKDIEELGLDRYRKVAYIQCDSPIPPVARPVMFMPYVDMSYKNRELAITEIAKIIRGLADCHPEAGFVHATYDEAAQLRRLLTSDRFMWHDHSTKQQQYKQFIGTEAGKGRIFVGSGLTEGIDLAGDLARWQVLTKVPSPSLADPAVAMKASQDPEWYAWESVKQLIQACGRVCRGPTDYGVSYIFDVRFKRLYDQYRYLFPPWFRDSIRW